MPRASPFFRPALIFTALLLASSFALRVLPLAAESAHSVPPPALDTPANPQATSEVAILAGGCFCAGFRTPAVTRPPHARAAGV